MIAFLQVCLYIFAGCAALGLIPASVLAAKARQPAMIAVSLIAAGFVMSVLISAAGDLR